MGGGRGLTVPELWIFTTSTHWGPVRARVLAARTRCQLSADCGRTLAYTAESAGGREVAGVELAAERKEDNQGESTVLRQAERMQ